MGVIIPFIAVSWATTVGVKTDNWSCFLRGSSKALPAILGFTRVQLSFDTYKVVPPKLCERWFLIPLQLVRYIYHKY